MPVYNGASVRLRILSLSDLRELGIYYSRVHIYRLVKAGKFPAPIKVGQNRIGWIESEIDEWLNVKIAERDARTKAA